MTDHFQTLVAKMKVNIAEMARQQEQLKAFFTMKIDFLTTWVNPNKKRKKKVKKNKQTLYFDITYKSKMFTSFVCQ